MLALAFGYSSTTFLVKWSNAGNKEAIELQLSNLIEVLLFEVRFSWCCVLAKVTPRARMQYNYLYNDDLEIKV